LRVLCGGLSLHSAPIVVWRAPPSCRPRAAVDHVAQMTGSSIWAAPRTASDLVSPACWFALAVSHGTRLALSWVSGSVFHPRVGVGSGAGLPQPMTRVSVPCRGCWPFIGMAMVPNPVTSYLRRNGHAPPAAALFYRAGDAHGGVQALGSDGVLVVAVLGSRCISASIGYPSTFTWAAMSRCGASAGTADIELVHLWRRS
jgi:hypothetical protein